MAIAFRAISTLVETSSAAGTRTITKPSGLADGDYVLIFVHDNLTGNPATTVTPTGFTLISRTIDGALTTDIFGKYITSVAGEGAWQVAYGASSVKLIINAVAYSGCDATTPLLTSSSTLEGTSAVTAHTTGSVNPTVANCWIVSSAADRTSTIPCTWTGTNTERTDGQNSGSNPISSMVQDSNGTVATGATTRTLTATVANAVATMFIGVLQPPSGTTFNQNPVDAEGRTDPVVKTFQRGLTDALGRTEVISKTQQQNKVEALGRVDSILRTFILNPVDAKGTIDVPTTTFAKGIQITDSLGRTDPRATTQSKGLVDSKGLQEVIGKTQSKGLIEAFGHTDPTVITFPVKLNIVDGMNRTDIRTLTQLADTSDRPDMSLVDDKREVAIAFLVTNAVSTDPVLRALSIQDLAHKYWSFRAGQLDNQAKSILDHVNTNGFTGWDWLKRIT